MAVSELLSLAQSGFAYRPTGLFVIPFAFSFAILLVMTFSLSKHLLSPSRVSPFRFFSLPDDQNRQRKALFAGGKLWNWGALFFAILTIGQLFLQMKYGRLASGLLMPRILDDVAFFALWSTAFSHVISAHHTLPLLRSTPTYEPPRALARPLFRPFSTTATIVTFPLLLLATLASALRYDSEGLFSLHKSIKETAQLFAEASSSSPAGNDTPGATILGPTSYTQMEATMASAWKSTLRGTGSAVKACALVILLIALFGVETRAYSRYWQLSKNARREQRIARYSSDSATHQTEKRSVFRPNSRQSDNREHAFVPTLPFEQPPPASLPMCRTATRSSTSSTGSVDYSYDNHDLRSATPYTTLPRHATPLERSHSSDLMSFSQHPATSTPSSASTRLPYRQSPPNRSQSIDSSESLEYLPYLSTSRDPAPRFSRHPETPLTTSSYLDRAYESQDRELEKYQLRRPQSTARRPGRQMSWEAPSTEDLVALGNSEERRSYDTLPIYASRAGSKKTKRNDEADEEEEEAREEHGSPGTMERTWSGDSYVSRDDLLEKRVRDVSCDMVEEGRTESGYAGPSSRCFKAMMKARLADGLWSSGILVLFTLLFVIKAIWAEEIVSSRSLSFFILVFEYTLPNVVLCAYFSIVFCRRASARIDKDLFKQTRWGQDLNEEGWWIPLDEAEAAKR
ncbi:uncharacterized protein JCM6883_002723 [Sporobolomyces salmoneus]|uniref:uncharacterized protein n=1 Tax=Sporobolomyces salmoneus TaxID=183962 RepID=UPI00316FEC53